MLEERILHILTEHLGALSNPTQAQSQYAAQTGTTIPFDRVATLSNKRFYVQIKRDTNITQNERIHTLCKVSELVKLRVIEQLPLLVVTLNNNICQIGFLLFWDYDRCHINNDIHWRELNAQTIEWLSLQLQAHRQRVVQLPLEKLRVKKTILLNTKDYIEPEIIYLRKFNNNYRMSTPPILTEQERFNRMLSGTPENEYPQDDLDNLILDVVKKRYPEAKVQSSLLLFDVDLIDIRHIKDKRKAIFSIHSVSTTYNPLGKIIGMGKNNITINLEIYYYQNVFKAFGISATNERIPINSQQISHFQHLLTTYEPISKINI